MIFPDFSDFKTRYENGESQIVYTRFPADLETPVSVLLKLGEQDYCSLFESVEGGEKRGRYSFIVFDPDIVWRFVGGKVEVCDFADGGKFKVRDGDVFESLKKLKEDSYIDIPEFLPPMSAGIFGYMGYNMVSHMEAIPDKNKDVLDVPDSLFMRPRIVVVFDSATDEIILMSPVYGSKLKAKELYDGAVSRLHDVIDRLKNGSLSQNNWMSFVDSCETVDFPAIGSNMDESKYCKMVGKAKDYILAGDIFQVVLSVRFEMEFGESPVALYRALRHLNPSPYSFYMSCGGFSLVGSSPETLVKLDEDDVVTIRPIAGTRRRGKDREEDAAMAKDLLNDAKEVAEHLMLLDLGRNDVGRVAKKGTVEVTSQMKIENYSHVMHIVSNVEGKLDKGLDAFDALMAGFPAGTVSGAPKIRAMEIIDELEEERRGAYAGAVGYFSANGTMDTCIALRTGLVKDGKLYVQAGAGIVADSVPVNEYKECVSKSKAVLIAAANVKRFL